MFLSFFAATAGETVPERLAASSVRSRMQDLATLPTLARYPKYVLLLSLAVLPPVEVVRAADDFRVSAEEMRSLGVTLQKLDAGVAPSGMQFPARVVLPPQSEQVISAPVAGMVDRLLVTENQSVKGGESLISLASPEFGDLQLKWMEASSEQRLAQQALKREKDLFAEGIIPARRVAEAEAASVTANARVRQARAALSLAGLDDAGLRSLSSKDQLQPTLTLRAKGAVTVLSIQVKPGQRVDTADPLMHTASLDRLWLDIDVPAAQAQQWSANGGVTVQPQQATARVLSVGRIVGAAQTVTVRAEVESGAENLRPGEFVQATLRATVAGEAWTLPIAAVARQGADAVVFVRTATGFSARPVKIVSSAAQTVTVTGALGKQDEVAVTSVIALKAAWLGESGGE